MAELTLNEYRSRLEILAQKADADGRHRVSEFTSNLINQKKPDLKVMDAIFKCYDSISDDDITVYNYLLDNNADVEWFHFVGFLSDQRGDITKYFDILKKCFDMKIKVEKLYSFEKQSDNIEKFEELILKEVDDIREAEKNAPDMQMDSSMHEKSAQDEYIHHLIQENNTLNKRMDATLDELNNIRSEQKSMIEKSVSDQNELENCRRDNEQLRQEVDRYRFSAEMAKRKYESQADMIDQLSSINDELVDENESLKRKAEELSSKYQEVLLESSVHTDIINDLNVRIKDLQRQLEVSSMNKVPIRVPDATDIMKDRTEQPQYGRDFDVDDNEEADEMPVMENEYDVSEALEEPEELDYNPADLIEIKDNKTEVKKHSNIFMDLIARHFEKKFVHKSIAEQDNLIFIKLMENDYKQETVRAVKSVMKNNQELSRLDLYKLVTNQKSDDDILVFCRNMSVLA